MKELELADIAKEIYDSGNRLKNGSKELFNLAKEMAESERKYRRALEVEIVKLRNDKVQATLIPDIARGLTADLKFERDLAEVRWQSAKQSLDAIKQQMSGLQTIFKYESEI